MWGSDVSTRNARRDAAFRRVEVVTAVGALIGGLEMLRIAPAYRDDGLNAWPITRTRLRSLTSGEAGRFADVAVRYPRVLGVVALRAVSAGTLVLATGRVARTGALTGLLGSGALLHLRSNYGNDGSDHFAMISFSAALVDKVFRDDPRVRDAALAFVAAQSCLSYFTSGMVKVTSPVWRSGEAMTGIMRTATYGDPALYRFLRSRPRLSRVAACGVIAFELSFPLVMVLPGPYALALLAGAAAFHVANARFMGLNRFLWSFTATYPAVAHFARGLRAPGPPPSPGLGAAAARLLRSWGRRGA